MYNKKKNGESQSNSMQNISRKALERLGLIDSGIQEAKNTSSLTARLVGEEIPVSTAVRMQPSLGNTGRCSILTWWVNRLR